MCKWLPDRGGGQEGLEASEIEWENARGTFKLSAHCMYLCFEGGLLFNKFPRHVCIEMIA